ncbi:MAG: hypothetical protein F4X19_09520, partial [Acidobacteria bacterium]|nr:hypothetical protein [Acidobacteriota bacterium]
MDDNPAFPARQGSRFKAVIERDFDSVQGRRRRPLKRRQPIGQGHGGNRRDLSVKCGGVSIRLGQLYHYRHAGLDLRGHVALNPDQRPHEPIALETAIAWFDQHAVNGNGSGHAAEE